jgi:hypothetical protein
MLSAPVEADLLRADSWTCSERLASDERWLDDRCGGWLEGNAVAGPDGAIVDLLRVDLASGPEVAALVRISADGTRASFDPATGFVPFPGGAKKSTVRFDASSQRWWSVSTPADADFAGRPNDCRNRLALMSSPDLRQWSIHGTLLAHPDRARHGFQYVDWQFAGDDLLALCRTAADDGQGGAANFHDANLITFHRIAGFRRQEALS